MFPPEIFEDPETTCLVCHKIFANARVLKRHRRDNGHYVPRAPVFRDRYIGRGVAAARGEAAVTATTAVGVGGGRGGGAEEGRRMWKEAVVGDKYEGGSVEEGEIVEVVSRVKRKRNWEDREEWETTDRNRDRGRGRQWGFAVNLNHIDHHKLARQSEWPIRRRSHLPLPRNPQRSDTISKPPAPGPHHHQRCRPLGAPPWKAKSDAPKALGWDVVVRPIAFKPSPCEADSRSSLGDDDDDDDGEAGNRLPKVCYQETIDPAEDLDVAPYRGDDE